MATGEFSRTTGAPDGQFPDDGQQDLGDGVSERRRHAAAPLAAAVLEGAVFEEAWSSTICCTSR